MAWTLRRQMGRGGPWAGLCSDTVLPRSVASRAVPVRVMSHTAEPVVRISMRTLPVRTSRHLARRLAGLTHVKYPPAAWRT